MDKVLYCANELSQAIKNSDLYINYSASKAAVKNNSELNVKIKEFKRLQLDYQTKLMNNIEPSFDEECFVSKQYSELMLNDHTKMFLKSEMELLETLEKVYSLIGENCEIEMDF